jgi:hypothetical protein
MKLTVCIETVLPFHCGIIPPNHLPVTILLTQINAQTARNNSKPDAISTISEPGPQKKATRVRNATRTGCSQE